MNARQFKVNGAPDPELARSPAAARVGELAAESDLFLAHFEYREQLPVPELFLPQNRPDLGEQQSWSAGILAESKYQGFRNDLMLGSFHPGHRAKWTAHELCHGLVGFAWHPGASDFFNALAARLSELLPVALFYFFDEAFLSRCPLHHQGGPLFARFCRDCERSATEGPAHEDVQAARFLSEGRLFVERELASIQKSLRLGRPIHSPWANLDLMSDGLAYAAAHGGRLRSQSFANYTQLFFPSDCGMHADLAALEARVIEVMNGILTGAKVVPWRGSRALWVAQDVGWRLMELACETEAEVAEELERLAGELAADHSQTGLERCIDGYVALNEDYDLPEPETMFAVGYRLPRGFGFSIDQITAGIESAVPTAFDLFEEQGQDMKAMARAFSLDDCHERRPLGHRFAQWLQERAPQDLADLALFEATVCHAPPADAATLSLEPRGTSERFLAAADLELLKTTPAVLKHVGIEGVEDEVPYLAIRRDASGESALISLPEHLGIALEQLRQRACSASELDLSEEDLATLHHWRLLIPEQYTL